MTVQEAIDEFKKRLEIHVYEKQIPEYYEAMRMAIKALEKQIPKKHVYENGNYNCPICSHPALSVCARRKNYCDNCGQKLDWSDT